jgi:hypothetical protein
MGYPTRPGLPSRDLLIYYAGMGKTVKSESLIKREGEKSRGVRRMVTKHASCEKMKITTLAVKKMRIFSLVNGLFVSKWVGLLSVSFALIFLVSACASYDQDAPRRRGNQNMMDNQLMYRAMDAAHRTEISRQRDAARRAEIARRQQLDRERSK